MQNKELIAHAIGIVKNVNAITVNELAYDLDINILQATKLLYALEDNDLVVDFGSFFACTDLADFN